jgi:hypothetical protein
MTMRHSMLTASYRLDSVDARRVERHAVVMVDHCVRAELSA